MRTDSAEVMVPATRLPRRPDSSAEVSASRRFYRVDVLVATAAVMALAEHFRARSAYWSCPWFALLLPVVFCLSWTAYRRRAFGWLRSQWARVEAYSLHGGPIPRLASVIFVVAPAWLLGLSNDRTLGAIDTRPVVPTAVSLLTEGNWELGEYFQPGQRKVSLLGEDGKVPLCFLVRPGGIYSNYPAGMVPFAVAVAGISAALEINLDNAEVQLHLEKMTSALVAALSVGLFFLISLRLVPPRPAWVSTAILALGSGVFSTASMGLWQHGGIIFWSLIILLVEFRREDDSTRWDSAIQGIACAQLVSCRLTSVAFLIPFGFWVFLRSPRRAFAIVGIAALAFSPWAWAYWATYGRPFGPSMGFLSAGLWSIDLGQPMAGVLFSPARGMLVYQPWILIAGLLAVPSIRGRIEGIGQASGPSGWGWFSLSVIVAQVVLISSWGCWWGGWCWGSRLVVEVVPLCALLSVRPIAFLWCTRRGRALVLSLGFLGLLAQVPAVYFNATRWNETAQFPQDAWSWNRPPFLDWHRDP